MSVSNRGESSNCNMNYSKSEEMMIDDIDELINDDHELHDNNDCDYNYDNGYEYDEYTRYEGDNGERSSSKISINKEEQELYRSGHSEASSSNVEQFKGGDERQAAESDRVSRCPGQKRKLITLSQWNPDARNKMLKHLEFDHGVT